jgi:hypothetical protein
VGGTSWDGAGRIWFAALTGGQVGPETDFARFAAATVAAAGEHADVVARAWETVGVGGAIPSGASPGQAAGSTTVAVRRTGGFAGLSHEGAVDLDGEDDRVDELRSLVGRVDVAGVPGGTAGADRFVYDFDLCGDRCRVPEQHLTPDLRRIADLVLR